MNMLEPDNRAPAAGGAHAGPSPLLADEPTMTRDDDVGAVAVPRPAHDGHEGGGYGADPLASTNEEGGRSSPPPQQRPPPLSIQSPPIQSLPPLSSRTTTTIIKRKLLLLTPPLLILFVLTDSHTIENNPALSSTLLNSRHHLAFATALARHPPSLRVFRLVAAGAWGLLCAAGALWVWEGSDDEAPTQKEYAMTDNGTNHGRWRGEAKEGYRDERDDITAEGDWEANPSSTMNTSSNGSGGGGAPRILPEDVGRLLFAPPPDARTGHAAWTAYRTHRPFRRLRRRRRKRSRSGGDEDDDVDADEEGEGMSSFEEKGDGSGSGAYIGDVDVTDAPTQAMPVSSSSSDEEEEDPSSSHAPLPPSSASVLGAALDVSTVTCVCLVFFTISSAEGGRYLDRRGVHEGSWMKFLANVAAPLFPLTLFVSAIIMVTMPWKKRKAVWTIGSLTVGAPFYDVTFRDGFVGDILTSTVRPLQDVAYTVFFVPLGVKAWWGRELYTLDAAAIPLERSWLLHTVVLPACTLSPLWWRFLQNLRQCYDAKERWPYLGNALKYLLAAEVAVFGLFDPTMKQSPVWLTFFLGATLYQIWWDVFMDWGLLERDPYFGYHLAASNDFGSRWLWWWPFTLRSRRLYRRTWIYYAIFGVNFCLRFVGMITLIPPVYLSRTTGLIVHTYNDPDFRLFAGSLVASAEIFRRTLWALLRLEWEVIKTTPESGKCEATLRDEDNAFDNVLDDGEEMKPMEIASATTVGGTLATKRPLSIASLSDMSSLNDIQVLSELCIWATVFSGIAIIAAAHREVL